MIKPKISFCTTCMSRLEHLKQTFLKNIMDNQDYIKAGGKLEFVLLNYGGETETEAWVRTNLQALIDEGSVVYGSYPAAEYFSMAHAKNMAHRLASGEVLCNVDADNFIGQGFATFMAENFARGVNVFAASIFLKRMLGEKFISGCGGRMAVSRDGFYIANGYSEVFKGWAPEDDDFKNRLIRHYLRFPKDIPNRFLKMIQHSDELRFENYDKEVQERSILRIKWVATFPRWGQRIRKVTGPFLTRVKANKDGSFGCGEVFVNFSKSSTKLDPVQ